jgi:hypothetical protein
LKNWGIGLVRCSGVGDVNAVSYKGSADHSDRSETIRTIWVVLDLSDTTLRAMLHKDQIRTPSA